MAQAVPLVGLNLRTLDGFSIGDGDENSTDPDYDGAKYIMTTLHSRKYGKPFECITIELTFEGGYRWGWIYHSQISRSGEYEQWGRNRRDTYDKNVSTRQDWMDRPTGVEDAS